MTFNQPAGNPGVSSTFAGDGRYLASSDADPCTIVRETATVAYIGPGVAVALDVPVGLSRTVTEAADANLGNRVDATQPQFTVRRISNNAVAAHCTASLRPTVPGSGVGRCLARLGIIGA